MKIAGLKHSILVEYIVCKSTIDYVQFPGIVEYRFSTVKTMHRAFSAQSMPLVSHERKRHTETKGKWMKNTHKHKTQLLRVFRKV